MFTKEDLKTGLFVKMKDGDLGVVAGSRIILQKGSYIDIFSYEDDLHCPANADCDIMEVRGGGITGHMDCFNSFDKLTLKYKRESFTLDKIKDGDIVIIDYTVDEYSFYKYCDLLLPINSGPLGIYNLNEFNDDLKFKRNTNIKIIKVVRPNRLQEHKPLELRNAEVIYEYRGCED